MGPHVAFIKSTESWKLRPPIQLWNTRTTVCERCDGVMWVFPESPAGPHPYTSLSVGSATIWHPPPSIHWPHVLSCTRSAAAVGARHNNVSQDSYSLFQQMFSALLPPPPRHPPPPLCLGQSPAVKHAPRGCRHEDQSNTWLEVDWCSKQPKHWVGFLWFSLCFLK